MNPMSDLPPLVEEDLYFLNKSILLTLYKGSTDVIYSTMLEPRVVKVSESIPVIIILVNPKISSRFE